MQIICMHLYVYVCILKELKFNYWFEVKPNFIWNHFILYEFSETNILCTINRGIINIENSNLMYKIKIIHEML